jgi:hypothetical protein
MADEVKELRRSIRELRSDTVIKAALAELATQHVYNIDELEWITESIKAPFIKAWKKKYSGVFLAVINVFSSERKLANLMRKREADRYAARKRKRDQSIAKPTKKARIHILPVPEPYPEPPEQYDVKNDI